MKFIRYSYLLVLLVFRNIRWLAILCFRGNPEPWPVLDYRMVLCARSAGLDPKENSIHKQLILDHIRERQATKLMKPFIRPDDVILELGANIGYYVLMESRILSDKGFIYAVEPALENIELLKKNIELNSVKQVEVNHMAISDRKGMARLYTGKACNLHSLINKSNSPDAEYVEVPTDTVDGFLQGRRPVTLLRMDIEGYEVEIIHGMTRTLASDQLKRLFIEIHPHRVDPEKMCHFLELLEQHGFEITHAISRDNFQRAVLGHCTVETISIAELKCDPRVLNKEHAFEIFFERS